MTKLLTALLAYLTFSNVTYADEINIECIWDEKDKIVHKFALNEKDFTLSQVIAGKFKSLNLMLLSDEHIVFNYLDIGQGNEAAIVAEITSIDRNSGRMTKAALITLPLNLGTEGIISNWNCNMLDSAGRKF